MEQREPYWRGVTLRLPISLFMAAAVGLGFWWLLDASAASALLVGGVSGLSAALLPSQPQDRRPAD
ncbi:hypothetical protein [Geodermatophilus sp. SYSU D01119]